MPWPLPASLHRVIRIGPLRLEWPRIAGGTCLLGHEVQVTSVPSQHVGAPPPRTYGRFDRLSDWHVALRDTARAMASPSTSDDPQRPALHLAAQSAAEIDLDRSRSS